MPDLSPFSRFADDARVWIHAADRRLSNDVQAALLEQLSSFFDRWTSHEHAVDGAATILHDRFLVVAAEREDGGAISGCGIDDLAHAVEKAATDLSVDWVPALNVLYRTGDGTVEVVSRPTFQKQGREGTVTPDTPVFDPSITELGALRDGQFERPARDSWHAQLLGSPAGAA